ncbi:hypothetical protein Ndes2526B_g03868 [Nannochloris sp. 'desiccata']|nr:putative Protein TIC 40, chloroplastic [Chlorella desiccata (nom. nud.)]
MQTLAAASALRGGLIALPISRKPSSRRPRTLLIADVKKAETAATPSPAPEDAGVPPYFLPPAPEAGAPGQQPTVYQAVPQYPVTPAPPAAQPTGFWSSVPPLVWIGVGILVANVIGSALNFVKGGPQKMQEMAMKTMMDQMMKQAMKGAPPGAAGGNPFAGMPGGFPGGMPGAGAGFPGGFPGGGAGGFPGAGFPPSPTAPAPKPTTAASQPPIDTTASPATSTSPSSSSSGAAASGSGSSTKKKSAFKDVDTSATSSTSASTTSNGSSSSTSTASPPPFTMPPGMQMPPMGGGAGTPPPPGVGGAESAGSMLDMLKNPEMQKMLYPYLPEPMRNPETFEWMLNSPEYRAQLEGMLTQQMGGDAPAAVQELIKDADMSPDKMKEQFDALGMTPEEFVGKVMSDPDLAASMTKPSVMAAIAECTKSPMNIFKYQNDEEVMRVFEKMSAMFPQAAGAMPGGMPPGMGGMTPPPSS